MASDTPYDYIPCRLVDYDGDLSKRWYIVFYVWDTDRDELVRKRFFKGLNYYDTGRERREVARDYIEEIDEYLKDGYTVGKARSPEEINLRALTITEAIQYVRERKQKVLKTSSMKDYRILKNRMSDYLSAWGLSKVRVTKLNQTLVHGFLDYMIDERGAGNRHRNNLLNTLVTTVNYIMDRDKKLFKENPAHGIPLLPVIKRKHAAYSPEQMKAIKKEITKRGDDQLLLFIQFIYFTLARPNEIQSMRIEQLMPEEDKIFIPASDSKNRKGDYVDMYAPLKKIIEDARLMEYPKHFYIFTTNGGPGPVRSYPDYFRRANNKVLEAVKLKPSKRKYDVYSYKHSGAINLYLSGVELVDIQSQCRHKTLTQTMEYLRELDLFRKKDHLGKVRGF